MQVKLTGSEKYLLLTLFVWKKAGEGSYNEGGVYCVVSVQRALAFFNSVPFLQRRLVGGHQC